MVIAMVGSDAISVFGAARTSAKSGDCDDAMKAPLDAQGNPQTVELKAWQLCRCVHGALFPSAGRA